MNTQPDAMRLSEVNFDTVEVIEVDDHLVLIQVTEEGESETLVIGPAQQLALLKLLEGRN